MSIRTCKMYLEKTITASNTVSLTRDDLHHAESTTGVRKPYLREVLNGHVEYTEIVFSKFKKAFKKLYRKQQRRMIYQGNAIKRQHKVLDKVINLVKARKKVV